MLLSDNFIDKTTAQATSKRPRFGVDPWMGNYRALPRTP